ncbi:hypothetical protein GCM10010211_49000 [Streptomyces albospinus]|uniref:Uncharacterized protein n=2 Tax=Streptomyces TaxID=1883 RepID=A0A101PBS6_9ACTN|nr:MULTISPECIES: hypothetical protein [Streptomyces]KUN08580.1 hypothetical protein AQI95_09500 [Streptomyces yokosukanensis]GGU77280.1 hypothetical protein GCM10010211_49000 [Streptomyces albospinus]
MSKMHTPGFKPVSLVSLLPVRYRSRVGAVLAALGVVVSVLSVAYADRPEIAVIVQILTALGVVAPAEEQPDDPIE